MIWIDLTFGKWMKIISKKSENHIMRLFFGIDWLRIEKKIYNAPLNSSEIYVVSLSSYVT